MKIYERAAQYGHDYLNNKDLLSLFIRENKVQALPDSLNELFRLSIKDLVSRGLSTKEAATVAAISQFYKRAKLENNFRKKIQQSRDIVDQIDFIKDSQVEEFWVIFMNRNCRVLATKMISRGAIESTVVDVRMIFKTAINTESCTCIALAHNHPSGNVQPSDADMRLTRQIIDAGKIMDIRVLDHVIIGGYNYYSFADEGKL